MFVLYIFLDLGEAHTLNISEKTWTTYKLREIRENTTQHQTCIYNKYRNKAKGEQDRMEDEQMKII